MRIRFIPLNENELTELFGGCDGAWSCLGYSIQKYLNASREYTIRQIREDNGFGWP